MLYKAKAFAEEAHEGQRRKFEGVAFVEHPKAVFSLLQSVADASIEMKTAALLHDTVEDTSATLDDIEDLFGSEVKDLVSELTTDKEVADRVGKAKYLGYKMAGMSDEALTIKLCDRYHNVHEIEKTPDDFQERYSRETTQTLSILLRNRQLNQTQKVLINKILNKVS